MEKSGLLISRDFRFFRERFRIALAIDGWAWLVAVTFMHGLWPLSAGPSSNAPERGAELLFLAVRMELAVLPRIVMLAKALWQLAPISYQRDLLSRHPETALFHNLGINLRI